MEDADRLSFDLTFAQLRTLGRWTPVEAEMQLCREIVARVAYPIPAPEADPRARYVTLARFFYDAMDAVRAMPDGSLPAAPNGELPKNSLAVFLMDATVSANEIVRSRMIDRMSDDSIREFADELQPGVVAFRRAIGTVAGADESFWTPAALGAGPLYTVRPQAETAIYSVKTLSSPPDDPDPEPEPEPRRRWWQRR